MVGRHSRKSGSGQEAFLRSEWPIPTSRNGCEALPEVREWSGSPPEGPGDPGVVGSLTQWSMSGRETLPEVR